MLIEQYGFLGGMWTAGLVNPIFDYKRKGGILREVIDNLKSMDSWSDKHSSRHTFDPEKMKFLADKMMEEADVQLLFHSFSTDPIVEDGSIKGVILANKSGSSAILAKVVIDCTGDGDVAARAGAPYEKGRPEDGLMQPMTMMFRIANADPKQNDIPFSEFRDLVDSVNEKEEPKLPHHPFKYIHLPINGDVIVQYSHLYGLDGTDAADLTKAEIEGRRQVNTIMDLIHERFPDLRSNYLVETPVNIGVRETRRIMGEYVLTREDLLNGQDFDDGMLVATFGIDIHDPAPGSDIRPKRGKVKPYEIPYRCLVPLKVDNLLMAGRCISGVHEAQASYRVTGNCVAMGEAAGIASALCLRAGIKPRELDGAKLKRLLKEREIML